MSEHPVDERSERLRSVVAAALAPEKEDAEEDAVAEHPTVDELIAYQAGDLGDAEAERLQDHLVACRDCLDRLSELEGFVAAGEQGPPEVDDLGDLEEAVAWRALRPKLFDSRSGPVPARASRYLAWPLAASLLVATVGMGFWAVHLQTRASGLRAQLARLAQPRPSLAIDLFADSTQRSPDGPASPVVLDTPAGADHLTLFLHLPEAPDHSAYEAAIAEADGQELWRGPVFRDEAGIFTLGIPRSFLTAGSYGITLYGGAGEARRPLARYPFELAAADE